MNMTFLGLHTKIGKQPVRDTRTSKLIAVFSRDELQEILDNSSGTNVSIPLELKFGNGQQRIWFVRKKELKKV